ncbi:MAG: hypothetical protein AAFS10_20605, partial [Myxococcota bacterium]
MSDNACSSCGYPHVSLGEPCPQCGAEPEAIRATPDLKRRERVTLREGSTRHTLNEGSIAPDPLQAAVVLAQHGADQRNANQHDVDQHADQHRADQSSAAVSSDAQTTLPESLPRPSTPIEPLPNPTAAPPPNAANSHSKSSSASPTPSTPPSPAPMPNTAGSPPFHAPSMVSGSPPVKEPTGTGSGALSLGGVGVVLIGLAVVMCAVGAVGVGSLAAWVWSTNTDSVATTPRKTTPKGAEVKPCLGAKRHTACLLKAGEQVKAGTLKAALVTAYAAPQPVWPERDALMVAADVEPEWG